MALDRKAINEKRAALIAQMSACNRGCKQNLYDGIRLRHFNLALGLYEVKGNAIIPRKCVANGGVNEGA